MKEGMSKLSTENTELKDELKEVKDQLKLAEDQLHECQERILSAPTISVQETGLSF